MFKKSGFLGICFLINDSTIMRPTIKENDLMIVKKIKKDAKSELEVEDIIIYLRDGEPKSKRIIYKREQKGIVSYVIKGDNNYYPEEILSEQVEGRVINIVSGGGVFVKILRSKVLTVFIFVYAILFIRYKRRMMDKNQKRRELRQNVRV